MSGEGTGEGSVLGGRYRLLRRLGRGGMAVVWAALDLRLRREVAVKILSDVLAGDDSYRRRFEREAQVAASLNYPGLVGVLDFGVQAERPYLVMELVDGGTLAGRIAAGTAGALDLDSLARELLGALAHIHAAGIVHRDVKPSNVLLTAQGQARLTDFGIARPPDATALTETGEVIGTRNYMAPEVQSGQAATARSDLYSLGRVLDECDGAAGPALVSLIDRLSSDQPADRPASAEQALAILSAGTDRAPPSPTAATERLPTGGTTRLRARGDRVPPPGRERGRLLATAAALAAVAAVVLLVVLTSGDADESPPSAEQPGRTTESSDSSRAGQAKPRTAPSPSAPDPVPPSDTASGVSCAAIESKKKQQEEDKKAAEKRAGDDQQAKEAIKNQFEAERKRSSANRRRASDHVKHDSCSRKGASSPRCSGRGLAVDKAAEGCPGMRAPHSPLNRLAALIRGARPGRHLFVLG